MAIHSQPAMYDMPICLASPREVEHWLEYFQTAG